MENKELNVTEMEQIAGGANKGEQPPKGGSSTPLPAKSGCNGTTVNAIMAVNQGIITNRNFIRAGFYIYVPV